LPEIHQDLIKMARSKNSEKWLREHFDDSYVKKSRAEGFRSRASYKLLEIQKKDRLIKPGMTVIDLGASPGSWSQVVANLVGPKGVIFANDLLPMDHIEGVNFIQGDFTDQALYDLLIEKLAGTAVDLVISDMAPNISGVKEIDQPRAIYLSEIALDLARSVLKPGANFLVKVFQGEGLEAFQTEIRSSFSTVKVRKPRASRSRSREIYLLAKGFTG